MEELGEEGGIRKRVSEKDGRQEGRRGVWKGGGRRIEVEGIDEGESFWGKGEAT